MQNLIHNTNSKLKVYELTKYILLVASCLLLWFYQPTHQYCVWLDHKAFGVLNSSLLYSHKWQLLWGYLIHPNESWLNIVAMVAINILGLYSLPTLERPKALAKVAYFWIFFQFILWFTHEVFSNLLEVQRASPSLIIEPWVILSESLNMSSLKISSSNSFPSGHALVLVFWLQFTVLFSKPWVHKLALATAIMLTLPRLFSGAHWLSDVIFTICYALLWFKIAVYCLEKIIVVTKKKIIGEEA